MIDISLYLSEEREYIEKAIPIIKDELKKNNVEMEEEKLDKFIEDVIGIAFAKGVGEVEGTMRVYTRQFIINISCQVVIEELKRNHIQMPEKNAYNLTQVIMFSLHLTDRGYSKEEIIDMTKNYIVTEKYREFISKE